jgi:hypothetical protein
VLTVGDDELIVGNDEGDREVASSEVAERNDARGLQSHMGKGPDELALVFWGCRQKNI